MMGHFVKVIVDFESYQTLINKLFLPRKKKCTSQCEKNLAVM